MTEVALPEKLGENAQQLSFTTNKSVARGWDGWEPAKRNTPRGNEGGSVWRVGVMQGFYTQEESA